MVAQRAPAAGAPAPTAHAWDQAAEGWNRHSTLIRAWLHDATMAMLVAARIEPGQRVLDIAAGAGDQTLDVARRIGPHGFVLACDISERILALAHDNARAAGFDQVGIRVADAQALGLAGAAFDAAVCRLGLMFCSAPLQALREAHAALKAGGRFAALVFSRPQHNPCLVIMMATALRHAGLAAPPPFEAGTLMSLGEPGRLERLLDSTGFFDIEVQALAAPFRLPSARHYIDFVRSSGAPIVEILAALRADAQRAAWDDMTQQLDVFTTPGGWQGPHELLLCSAATPQ